MPSTVLNLGRLFSLIGRFFRPALFAISRAAAMSVAAFFSVKPLDWVNSSKLVSATSRADVYPASCKRLAVISPTPGMLSSDR